MSEGETTEPQSLFSELPEVFKKSFTRFGFELEEHSGVGSWVVRNDNGEKPIGVAERFENGVCAYTPLNVSSARISYLPKERGGFSQVFISLPHPTRTDLRVILKYDSEGEREPDGDNLAEEARSRKIMMIMKCFIEDNWDDRGWEEWNFVKKTGRVKGFGKERKLAAAATVVALTVVACGIPVIPDIKKVPIVETASAIEDEAEKLMDKYVDEPLAPVHEEIEKLVKEPLASWEKLTDSEKWQALGEGLQTDIQEFFTDSAKAKDFLDRFTFPEDINNIKALGPVRAEIEEELKNLSAPTPSPAE